MSTKRRNSASSVGSSRSGRGSVGSVGSQDKDPDTTRKIQNESKNTGENDSDATVEDTAAEKEGSRASTPASLRKDRASALEFLEEVVNSPAISTQGEQSNSRNQNDNGEPEEDSVDKTDKMETVDSSNLDFRVASPALSKMIDESSDCSSPLNPMFSETMDPRSNPTSPLMEAPTLETESEPTMEVEQSEPMDTDTLEELSQDEAIKEVPEEATSSGIEEAAFVPKSPQKARRGRRRNRIRLGMKRRPLKKPKLRPENEPMALDSQVTEANSQDSLSSGTSLPDLPPILESLEEPPQLDRMDMDETTEDGLGDSQETEDAVGSTQDAEGGFEDPGVSSRGRSPRGRGRANSRSRGRGTPRGRGRGGTNEAQSPHRVKRRGPGRGRKSRGWTHNKRSKRARSLDSSMPTEDTGLDKSVADDGPQYEGVSPTGHHLSPDFTPEKSKTGNIMDVERRMEEIQSLVSSIQKDSADTTNTVTDSTVGSPTKSGHKHKKGKSKWLSNIVSTEKSSGSEGQGNLKMTIKFDSAKGFHRKRGHKRNRYSEDGEYIPRSKRANFEPSPEQPKRSSGRKSEHDLILDHYRYTGDFSEDSRSPSPLASSSAPKRSLGPKACKVQLFDFVKCLNVTDVNQLRDVSYNKSIRRQIRALEKGHYVARMKANPDSQSLGSQNSNTSVVTDLVASLHESFLSKNSPDPTKPPHKPEIVNGIKRVKRKKKFKAARKSPDTVNDAPAGSPGQKRKFKCRQCSFTSSDLPCIQEHINIHAEPFYCSECKTAFPQISTAIEHTKSAHPNSQTKVIKVANFNPNDHFDELDAQGNPLPHAIPENVDPSKTKFECKQCPFSTSELVCIQEHVLLHAEPFHCSVCKKTFTLHSQATEHIISAHPNTDGRVVRANFDPNEHFTTVALAPGEIGPGPHPPPEIEKETNYQCQLCPFRTDDRQQIETHLQTNHRAEYQYVCKICDLAFCRKKETMLKHFKKWHPDMPLDFTTAPGVEDPTLKPTDTSSAAPVTIDDSGAKTPTRPASVISIASGSPAPSSTNEIRRVTSGDNDDVEVISINDNVEAASDTTPAAQNEDSTVLGAETRPCTYKCLECGAKTDTFDVICAHLEVSHPSSEYSFACPFCSDYKAKTCSFVAEHIRTAHPESSGRCMERKLENADKYVKRQFTGPPVSGAASQQPARTDSARSSNQENRSPDDEVVILDVATTQPSRQPLQPLSLVQHRSQEPQPPAQQPNTPNMVQIFPDFAVPKAEFDRYQVFNLNPPSSGNPMPRSPILQQLQARPSQTPQRPPQPTHRPPQPAQRPPLQRVPQATQLRPMRPQQAQIRPQQQMRQQSQQQAQQMRSQQQQQQMMRSQPRPQPRPQQPQQAHLNNMNNTRQPRPMPQLQPRPFIPSNYYPQMQAQMPQASQANTGMSNMNMTPVSGNIYPQLMQLMGPGGVPAMSPTSMAQPMLYNGVNNPPR